MKVSLLKCTKKETDDETEETTLIFDCSCCIMLTVFLSFRYPAPPAANSAYGQPLQTPYNSMASPAPPPNQQLTNQMSAMNLGNYGKFAIYLCLLVTHHISKVVAFIDYSTSVEGTMCSLDV